MTPPVWPALITHCNDVISYLSRAWLGILRHILVKVVAVVRLYQLGILDDIHHHILLDVVRTAHRERQIALRLGLMQTEDLAVHVVGITYEAKSILVLLPLEDLVIVTRPGRERAAAVNIYLNFIISTFYP